MSDNEEVKAHRELTPRQLLAEGWRLTRAILARIGVEIPDTIEFEIDGENQIRVTFVATPDELAEAVAALDEAIEHRSENTSSVPPGYVRPEVEELKNEKAALMELEKRASRIEAPAPTTVFEALFPDFPIKKRTASEITEAAAKTKRWLAIREEEGLKIDPETAELRADPRSLWCIGVAERIISNPTLVFCS
jgi:hypothetical protein